MIPGSPFKVNITKAASVVSKLKAVKATSGATPESVKSLSPEGPGLRYRSTLLIRKEIVIDAAKVSIYGLGLEHGFVGSTDFTINTLNAGPGDLAVTIDGPEEVKIICEENEDGTYHVSYNPTVPGEYSITITFDGQMVSGSPFTVLIAPEDEKKSEEEIKMGAEAQGVAQEEVVDPAKVKAYGEGLKNGTVGKVTEFIINALDGGPGDLSLAMEGPVEVDIDCQENPDGTYQVLYTPTQPGEYTITIGFDDHDIPGSPYRVIIE